MPKSKVLIIGGGPAGSSAAYLLAKQGIDVALIDKDRWPRDKVCGGGLTANCLPFLEKMGVLEEVDRKADFKFNGYVIHSPEGEQVKAPVCQRENNGSCKVVPFCYVIKRHYFDQILLDKAKEAGVKIFTETQAVDVEQKGQITVNTKSGQTFQADILVVADGSGGPITRQFNKDLHNGSAIAVRGYYSGVKNLSATLEFFLDSEIGFGYGWLFPLGEGRANIGVGLDAAYLKKRNKNIRQVFKEMLQIPQLKERMAEAKLDGKLEAFPLRMGYEKDAFRKGKVLFAGDSAKLIYPLSGEGISYALQSGGLAAEVITKTLKASPLDYNILSEYEMKCEKAFGDFKYATRLQKLMGRPKIQKFFYKNAAYDSVLGQRAVGILEHSSDVKTFFNTKTILKSFYTAAKRKLQN